MASMIKGFDYHPTEKSLQVLLVLYTALRQAAQTESDTL